MCTLIVISILSYMKRRSFAQVEVVVRGLRVSVKPTPNQFSAGA